MSAAVVKEAWDRLELWCRQHQPELLEFLNPGASKAAIKAVENVIQQPLPEDLRTSLMIHNGDKGNGFLFGRITLATCERITSEWTLWQEAASHDYSSGMTFYPEDAIMHRYYDPGWIPVAIEEGCGNCFSIDLVPAAGGCRGQVIPFGRDINDIIVLAPSWGEFLLSTAKLLESGILFENSLDEIDWSGVWDRNCLDGLGLWVKDGRWPIITFEPSWRTSTVMALATGMDETRDFSSMPILADALQEECEI